MRFIETEKLSEKDYAQIRKDTIAGNTPCFEPFVNSILACIHAQEDKKGKGKIIYIGLGSGTGDRDAEIMKEIANHVDPRRLNYVAIDPNVSPSQSLFEIFSSYNFIQAGLASGQNYIGLLQANHAANILNEETILVATARFMFHHAGTSLGKFLEQTTGLPLVMLESPIDYENQSHRVEMLARDLLANLAFHPDWVIASNSGMRNFHANYLETNVARNHSKTQWVSRDQRSPVAILSF
jgi:hypothetical protein